MAVLNQVSLNSTNWMSYLPDRTRLFDVVLPGSHDSGSYGYTQRPLEWAPGSWLPATTSNLNLTTYVQTNEERADFRTQLDKGLRFWDLRLTKVSDAKGSNLVVFHGPAYVNTTLNQALKAAQDFLRANPKETLVISFKKENPYQQSATSEINADDIQAYLDQYSINSSLPAADQGLWIAGPDGFTKVVSSRGSKGLADLNEPGSGYQLETRNPRTQPGVKLNYENLTLGDVRGKIILHMRDFNGYSSWNNAKFAALDGGTYTSGLYFQDNYSGPSYAQKKADVSAAAKGKYAGADATNLAKKFSWNFTSATLALADTKIFDFSKIPTTLASPADYGLTINSGSTKRGLKTSNNSILGTDFTSSLKGMLSAGGDLQTWNLAEKRAGRSGLRGTIAGDYYLAPQAWYNDFWNGFQYSRNGLIPNLNSSAYAASDHLSQAIWRQNALYGTSFAGAVADTLTGLPVFKEGSQGAFHFIPYLGNADSKGVQYELNLVAAGVAGLSPSQMAGIKVAPLTVPVRFDVAVGSQANQKPVVKTFDASNDSLRGSVPQADARVTFTVPASAHTDGYHFFRLTLVDPLSSARIGAPSYFAVTDTL